MVAVREPIPFLETERRATTQPMSPVALRSASPAESEHPELEPSYEALFEVALSSQKEGDYRKAIAYYTKAIEFDPHIPYAYVNRGGAYESMGELDLALRDLDTALAIEPISEAYHNRGNVHFTQGRYALAVQDYGKSLELEHGNAGAHIYRGHASKYLEFYDDAIRDYNEALALDPGNADAHLGIGIVHYLRGDHDSAIEHYDQALELDSGNPNIYLNRGASFSAKSDYDSAERDFDKALELDPEHAYACFARGAASIGRGHLDSGLRYLDKCLELAPDYAYGHAVHGSVCLKKGDLDRAIDDFDKALELDPNNTYAYNNRGVAYELKSDSARAMQDYDQALRIGPNQAAYANRGFALLRLSQWDKARPDLLSARNMGMDLASAFDASHGGAAAFEERHDLELPHDITELVSGKEAAWPVSTGESLLEVFRKIRRSVPDSAYEALPPDGSSNHKHHLYGWPRQ